MLASAAMVRRLRAHRIAPSRATPALRVLVIALSLLFGQGAAALHLWMVPHARCEHGELIEIGAAARAPASSSKADEPRIEVGARADGEHQHCDVNAQVHRLPEVSPWVGEASLLCIEPAGMLGERGETRPVAVLALAPKSSPPSA